MDYETFNLSAKGGKASQFAAIRTDDDLNIIKERSVNLFCEQSIDNIPSPMAALVTGLSPARIQRFKDGSEQPPKGNIECKHEVLSEYFFTERILKEMSEANTCTLGYNSISFDDEYTRNLAYRNLIDPYEREWKNRNSRFDVYYLMMATFVLRPNLLIFPNEIDSKTGISSINPKNGKNIPSLRLEELSKANGIIHANAHDAFSDVEATIDLMKLVMYRDRGFFDQMFSLREKSNALMWVDRNKESPFLHISALFGKVNDFCGIVKVVTLHPTNKNIVLCLDLHKDIQPFIDLQADELKELIYASKAELQDLKMERLGVIQIKLNQCPVLAELKEIKDRFNDFNFDKEALRKNLDLLNQNFLLIKEKLLIIYNSEYEQENTDSDLMIYTGGFFSDLEKVVMEQLHRSIEHNQLHELQTNNYDNRLSQMIMKIKGRNFPEVMSSDEKKVWQEYAKMRLLDNSYGGELTIGQFNDEVAKIDRNELNTDEIQVLDEIIDYVSELKEIHNIV